MITSTSNQQVKEVQKLQKSSKFRAEKGLFVVEGRRMLSEIPSDYISKVYVIATEATFLSDIGLESVELVSESVLKAMSREVRPQGMLALVKMKAVDQELTTVENPLIIALDCVQDPGNLGTIIRTAEAAGVNQIIMSKGTVDLYNSKVVKSTMGAIYRMSIWKETDLAQVIGEMKEKGIGVYAAHLDGVKNHYDYDYRQGTCFLMGNEGNGLSDEVASLASDYLRIPMTPEAESLNVAIATSVLLYEAVRQRQL